MIHPLEPRRLLADMVITGTVGADVISIKQTNVSTTSATIEVTNGGLVDITVSVDGSDAAVVPGDAQSFADIGVLALADLRTGDDSFTADPSVRIVCNVSGGNGKDTITGGSGADVLAGDKAQSGEYRDVVHGGPGNDTLYGYGGRDVLYGEEGNDSIRGGLDNDTVDPGLGNDRFFGEKGNDVVFNDDGFVDTLDGGAGSDRWSANVAPRGSQTLEDIATNIEVNSVASGQDNPNGLVFLVTGTDAAENIEAHMDGDTLVVTIDGLTRTYSIEERKSLLTASVNGTDDPSPIPPQESDLHRIGIQGGGGDDTIVGGAGIENIMGDDGNDQLTANGAQRLYGGTGNDLLIGSTTRGTRLAGDLPIYVTGDTDNPDTDQVAGDDTIYGGPFADEINAGPGSDLIRPGLTQETGGDPNAKDHIVFNEGDTGRDVLDFSDRKDALTITYEPDGSAVTIQGAAGDSTYTGFDSGLSIGVIGGQNDDSITGSNLADSLLGGGAADTINGGAGNDTIKGGAGDDSLNGGNDNDTIYGDFGADIIKGGAGGDNADYRNRSENLFLALDGLANDGAPGEGDNIADDVENLTGGSGNDFLSGNDKNNILAGKDGNDTLRGGNGNDTLFASNGDDMLFGGNGNDSLKGDKGNDTLFGENNADVLDLGDGIDAAVSGKGNDLFINPLDGVPDTLKGLGGVDTAQGSQADGEVLIDIDVIT